MCCATIGLDGERVKSAKGNGEGLWNDVFCHQGHQGLLGETGHGRGLIVPLTTLGLGTMKQILLIIDVQPCFSPPDWLVAGIRELTETLPSVATVERHDETITPFRRQLDWAPPPDDESLIAADRIFYKHGYLPPPELVEYLRTQTPDRVLVCGVQTDTCLMAAGFALFDAGLQPTLLASLTQGSSLNRSGSLGAKLWKHHFGEVIEDHRALPG